MLQELKVSIDSLREGKNYAFEDKLSSEVFNIQEKEISFDPTIKIKGKAYLAADELIINFDAEVTAFLPCGICNEMTPFSLKVNNTYQTAEVSSLKAEVDLATYIREALLIELPLYVECKNNCPKREELKQYLSTTESKPQKELQNPFSNFFKKTKKTI